MQFTADNFIKVTGASPLSQGGGEPAQGISTDSRTICDGELFFALKGPHFDGHDFCEAALAKGAWGIVVESPKSEVRSQKSEGKTYWIFKVRDTLTALGDIAAWWRRRFNPTCIAITGSNGKTTTKEILATILNQRFSILKTEGNFNNRIGVPLTLARLKQTHQVAVLELGMNAPGEIAGLTQIVQPRYGLVTNASAAHLERLHTVEKVAEAKAELWRGMSARGTAIFNGEDPLLVNHVKSFPGRKLSFGLQDSCDVKFEHMESWGLQEMELDFSLAGRKWHTKVKGSGLHQVMNVLAAAACSYALELDPRMIVRGLELFKPLPMRMEQIQLANGVRLVNDCYNANPTSMEMAMRTVGSAKRQGRFLALLGDMKELGENSEAFHEEVGEKAIRHGVQKLFLIGECAQAVAQGAKRAGISNGEIFVADSANALLKKVFDELKPGDVLLVKGSRAMHLETIVDELKVKFGA